MQITDVHKAKATTKEQDEADEETKRWEKRQITDDYHKPIGQCGCGSCRCRECGQFLLGRRNWICTKVLDDDDVVCSQCLEAHKLLCKLSGN